MMVIFDYIYYRLAKFFYKKDGIDAFRALVLLTVIESLIIAIIVFSIWRSMFDISQIAPYKKLNGKIGAVLYLLILFLNYLKYKRRYWDFSKRWKESETSKQTKVRGILVILTLVLTFVVAVFMSTSAYRN